MKSRVTLATAALLALAGCGDFFNSGGRSAIDDELTALVESGAADGTVDYFLLPDEDELALIPQDPRNPLTLEKVALGRLLFHETALSVGEARPELSAGTYSCASCHNSRAGFQSGRAQGIGEGGSGFGVRGERRVADLTQYSSEEIGAQGIRTPSLLNVAYSMVGGWNGALGAHGPNSGLNGRWKREDPSWNNHLGYLGPETEAIAELDIHGLMNPDVAQLGDGAYATYFEAAFPFASNQDRYSRESIGLAMAAYMRTLLPTEAPFQRWLAGNPGAMNKAEKRGAILFFGKANCVTCHSGPGLGSDQFEAVAMSNLRGSDMVGSSTESDELNLGRASATGIDADKWRFKVPQLYNLSDVAHLGHGSTFNTILSVVAYKARAKPQLNDIPEEALSLGFVHLQLSSSEILDLTVFLETGLRDSELRRFEPRQRDMPSGQCPISNDEKSFDELGCR